jgi:hypothetical protein
VLKTFNFVDHVLLYEQRPHLNAVLETKQRLAAVAFKVEALEASELLHVSNVRETFVMEVKLFVERRCSVIFLPFFFEKFPEKSIGHHWGTIDISVIFLVVTINTMSIASSLNVISVNVVRLSRSQGHGVFFSCGFGRTPGAERRI